MKKILTLVIALVISIAMLLVASCGSEEPEKPVDSSSSLDFGEDVLYISDSLYYTFYQGVNSNPEQYNGKKYAIDGMFHLNKFEGSEIPQIFRYHLETDPSDGKEYAYYRGFMLKGDVVPANLEEKCWIRIIGTLEVEAHEDHVHAFINVESYELLETPGQEYVV